MTRPKRRLLLAALLLALLGGLWPAEGVQARQSMSFRPGDRARVHAASHRRGARRSRHATRATYATARPKGGANRRRATADGDEGPAAKAVPGAGFTMENGVLTYPAPARFQPKNLRHDR